MPPKPKGKGNKTRGFTLRLPILMSEEVCGKKAGVCSPYKALDESVTEDEPADGQVPDSNQMETMMSMLLDLSSRLPATEKTPYSR